MNVSGWFCGGSWAKDQALVSIFHFPVGPNLRVKFLDPGSQCLRKETPLVPVLKRELSTKGDFNKSGLEFVPIRSTQTAVWNLNFVAYFQCLFKQNMFSTGRTALLFLTLKIRASCRSISWSPP